MFLLLGSRISPSGSTVTFGVRVDRQHLGQVVCEVATELVPSLLGGGLAAELQRKFQVRSR